jgi:general transcriptional corepressor CYC8
MIDIMRMKAPNGHRQSRLRDQERQMSECQLKQLCLEKATKCAEEALKNNPGNRTALYDVGRCYLESNDIGKAEEAARRLFGLDGASYGGYVLLGHISLRRGLLKEAHDNLIRAYFKATQRDRYLIYGIALFYESVGEYRSARPWFCLLNKLGVEEYKAYEILFRTGVCLKKLMFLYDAANTFRVILYNPTSDTYDINVQIQMAHIHELETNHDAALEGLDMIKESASHYFMVSRLYAWIEFKTKKYTALRRRYKSDQALKEDPYIKYLVGRMRFIEGEYHEALKKYTTISSTASMNGMVQNSIGCAHFGLKQYSQAKAAFASAIELNPEFPEALENFKTARRMCEERAGLAGEDEKDSPSATRETAPDISKTSYLDSQVFFGGHASAISPSSLSYALPFKISRLDHLSS